MSWLDTLLEVDLAEVEALNDNQRDFYEERAAIIEYDGELPRLEAERMALELAKKIRDE